MRPRKTLIPLSLDNLQHELEPGRAYSAEALCCMFDASPAALREVLDTAIAAGTIQASRAIRGFRRTYWVPAVEHGTGVAGRRWQPNVMTGELVGYTDAIRRLIDLRMASRRV